MRVPSLSPPAALALLGISAGLVYWLTSFERVALDSFVPLADAFLQGRLYIAEPMPWLELVPRPEGGWYSPFPPVPALTVLPFVAIWGPGFDQGIAAALFGGANVVLVWVLLGKLSVAPEPRGWLTIAFAFGTVHWWAAGVGTVWLYALVIAVFFALLSLILTLDGRWPFVAGICLGLAAGSRLPVGLTVILPLAVYGGIRFPPRLPRMDRASLRAAAPRVRAVVLLLLGLAIPALAVALYNVARFGRFTEFGYDLIPGVLDEPWYASGTLALEYIPRNLHVMFIRGFDFVEQFPWFRPNWMGTSLLLTTPILLWLVKARSRHPLVAYGWIAALVALIPIVTHGGVGFTQFGYRRILDVVPVLWLLLGWVLRDRISTEAKIAIVVAVIVNAYGIWAILALNFVSF